ncbi:protein kinase 1 [Epinotia aporema granulovirus]|uniref:Protein kinase 1 n=1 Tax=Epinotia aporema granulovirus TaxID=166056 RepID=K4EQ12_9BBAC|nr:protein kinase 1 [Epinotia aporema granulovirus]AER41432.1 protein kinase 1 [Epinotia aporema granulovirus]
MSAVAKLNSVIGALKNIEIIGPLNVDENEADAYENVYLCKKKDTQTCYVLKVVTGKNNPMEYTAMKIMNNHNNFVTIHDYFDVDGVTYFIMDYIKDGDLYNIIEKKEMAKRDIIDENKCRKLVLSLVNALNRLHAHKIIHNDIKLENLLYDIGKNHLYICDCGLSHSIDTPSCDDGTFVYFSPEKINKEVNQVAFDWWAVGVVTYEILAKNYPFDISEEDEIKQDPKKLMKVIKKGIPKIKRRSETANDFVRQMLTYDITKRLSTYNQIIKHKFLQ